jgi:mediator of RNA polymerase II transcription subunit 5
VSRAHHAFVKLLTVIDLVDTFLLPSLVGAITWLAHHLWESKGDSSAIVLILQTLIAPSSISNEASLMLSSVLNIIAKPLEHSLRWLQRSEPTRQDIEPLSKTLKPHLSFPRSAGSDHTELETWSTAQPSGLSTSIRHIFSLLVSWSLTHGINIMPTSYTHRQLLTTVRLLGAKRTLHAILEELKVQSAAGSASVSIDVATALICAPDISAPPLVRDQSSLLHSLDDAAAPTPLQTRLSLRDALRTEAENAPKLHKTDVEQAEVVIRLYRRVEAMMAEPVRISDHDVAAGGGLGGSGLDLSVGVGVLHDAQDIDAFAVADQDMIDAMAMGGDGMMGVGHDDLISNLTYG